jgi:hypothetical protein
MGLIYMASVHLTIRQKYKDYKTIEIPLCGGGGGGRPRNNSDNIVFVFICHHQTGEKMRGMRGAKTALNIL